MNGLPRQLQNYVIHLITLLSFIFGVVLLVLSPVHTGFKFTTILVTFSIVTFFYGMIILQENTEESGRDTDDHMRSEME